LARLRIKNVNTKNENKKIIGEDFVPLKEIKGFK